MQIDNEINTTHNNLINQKISDSYQYVTHCNLPTINSLLTPHLPISLYDGKGNKLSYSFYEDEDENENKRVHNIFKNVAVNNVNNNNIITNSCVVNYSKPTTKFTIDSGVHNISIPVDNNTTNGVTDLIDNSDSDKYIANVEYLNKSLEYASGKINDEYLEYLEKREWSNLITGAYYSNNATINTGKGINHLLIFASCNVLVGECHSRTASKPSTKVTLKCGNTTTDVDVSLNCCKYWTTGNKSPSSYARWIQTKQHIPLFLHANVSPSTNYNVSLNCSDDAVMTNPYIICVRCKIKQ